LSIEEKLKKIKILSISDHPLSPSGVGTQTRYVLEAALRTGLFEVISLGGAIKHEDYRPSKTEEFGDDWIIFPVDGYGDREAVRGMIATHRPDMLWFMTDPRFWHWLWDIDNEIRKNVPLVYYHVWDNKPYPTFNKKYYESNDKIITISQVTNDIVKNVAPDVDLNHIPHSVNTDVFKRYSEQEILNFKKNSVKPRDMDKFVFFWNNRNARRKQSGSLVYWFKDFLDIVGHDKAMLIMHTDARDPNGQDLFAIMNELGLEEGQLLLSERKYPQEVLAMMYNMADCTINISDAEGFGLATLESLACETPIIVNMTGGLQEQVTDGEKMFGIGLEPTSKAIIGSQDVPFIYEDRLSKEVVVDALLKMYNMGKDARMSLGKDGRGHVMKNYNFEDFNKKWIDELLQVHEKYGSWTNRKNYKSWKIQEI